MRDGYWTPLGGMTTHNTPGAGARLVIERIHTHGQLMLIVGC